MSTPTPIPPAPPLTSTTSPEVDLARNAPTNAASSVAPSVPQLPQTPPSIPRISPPRKRNKGVIVAVIAAMVLVPTVVCVGAALLAASLGVFVSLSQVEQTSTKQFQFVVTDHPTIVVSNTSGVVTITSGAVQRVTVVATKHARASNTQTARSLLDGMTATAVATASGARITATTGPSRPLSQQTVDLRITVPQTSDLTVTLTAGTLSIDSMSGIVNVTATAGTVDIRDMEVQGVSNVNLTSGTVHFDGALANDAQMTVTVTTGTVAIRLPATSATHFDASTNVGSVAVSSWATPISRVGAGQSSVFDLNPQPTSTMTVRVNVGSITLSPR